MIRDLRTSLVILIVSSGVAVAANSLRKSPIPWLRTEPPPLAVRIDARSPGEPTSTSAPGDQPGVVTLESVLRHLGAGTATFIDARESHDYEEGHLKSAMNLPSSAIYHGIQSILSMVPVDSKVIVYCGGGTCEASHNVSDALRAEFGFSDVSIYTKGWEEVEASGRFKDFIVKGENP